ncbi:DDE-type integrase/transposase/recombinase [uncultured Methanoregula sp.]|uniref:DDE-type integrase/transposase/recombinase n=2 Tax=uncultured Methanoregula sp. TaxID=1005933 RepID=UPI002AABFD03|nr:DDE-type integrase/transposase/recombinase [uncultured Methanoregula sp.]
MSRLTNQDIVMIILYWGKGKPVVEISQKFQVTRQRVYQLITLFKASRKYPTNKKTGRKPEPINERTEALVLESYRTNAVGATYLEKKIEETYGIHIPHNRIYRVLLNHDLVEINMRKRQQRKYVRYERTHSMSMWQGDWKEFELDSSKRWLVAFMDDSSRLITCYGVFDAPTTENTITVLNQGFKDYGTPREILTDHGTQFVSARNREHAHHTFGEFLNHHNINHILAGVKHPQTNGKIERFFGEVERRISKFGSVDAVVHWHNVIKPHMSLDFDEPCNAFWYRLPPERILDYAQKWLYV